jgi:hypothetical protein
MNRTLLAVMLITLIGQDRREHFVPAVGKAVRRMHSFMSAAYKFDNRSVPMVGLPYRGIV